MVLEHVEERQVGVETDSGSELLVEEIVEQSHETYRRQVDGIGYQPVSTVQLHAVPAQNLEIDR